MTIVNQQRHTVSILMDMHKESEISLWRNYLLQQKNYSISPETHDLTIYQKSMVVFITDSHCIECVKFAIQQLKYATYKNFNQILILYDFENERKLKIIEQFTRSLNSSARDVVFIKYDFQNSELDFHSPSYAIIDDDFNLKNIFIPEKEKPSLSENYFSYIE
jgi:hypothetical protein